MITAFAGKDSRGRGGQEEEVAGGEEEIIVSKMCG